MTCHVFKVGRVWHYRFQIGAARIQRSTRERARSRAEPVAQRAYEEAVTRANGGTPVPTLDALIADWLHINGPTSSAEHVRHIETCRRLHLYDLGAVPVDAISTRHIELARNRHLQTHQPSSTNHWLRILRLVVTWAIKRGILARLPWQVAMLKIQKRPRVILPIDVARAWFDALDAATTRAPTVATAVRLMFGLGLRASEAFGARWEWIDWQRAIYTPGRTKGREAEPIPLPRWLVDHLAPRRAVAGLIAPRADGTQHSLWLTRQAMRQANVACSTANITPHRLRGSFATLLSEEGVPSAKRYCWKNWVWTAKN